jgi:predicted TIM-barrel fold metal-dependent hydrolase
MRGRAVVSWVSVGLLLTGSITLAQRGQRGGGPGEAGQRIQPGEECPQGTTEVRPDRCQPPAMQPPTIVDYRPRSSVVSEEHKVPKAKFPVVDIHNHEQIQPDNIDRFLAEMDSLNLRVLVNLSGGSGDRLKQSVANVRTSKTPDRFRLFANVDWNGAGGPEWSEKAVAGLEQAVKDGALGLKVFKNLGLTAKKADGSRLKVDDADLDPVWQTAARLNIPVLIHVADPFQFFDAIDFRNERWLELAVFPNRQYPQERFPSFEQLMTERDNMFARNPKTRFIVAHFGWHGNDLARAGRLLDRLPNVYFDVAAVLYEFGRQPRASREFFVKYQDRIIFGKDAYYPTEYPYYWRVFETNDEYFDYYRPYHFMGKLYGMGLPDAVLKKLYYKNALKVVPGLPQNGWPQ